MNIIQNKVPTTAEVNAAHGILEPTSVFTCKT